VAPSALVTSGDQNLGKKLVTPRSAAIHLRYRTKHRRWTPPAFAAVLDKLHQAFAEQALEVEADSIRMHEQQLGNRDDAHRDRRGP
jgi:hypothetical protein